MNKTNTPNDFFLLNKENSISLFTYFIAFISIIFIFKLNLLPILFSGLLTYIFMEKIENCLFALKNKIDKENKKFNFLNSKIAKILSIGLIANLIFFCLFMLVFWIMDFLTTKNLQDLFVKIELILEQQKNNQYLPSFIYEKLPNNIDVLKTQAIDFLKQYANEIKNIGKVGITSIVYIILGCVIGALISFSNINNKEEINKENKPLLKHYLQQRIINFKQSFDLVFLAQIKISLVNTFLTSLYIYIALPFFDINLPFKNIVIALTFILGLIPVLGNLISNTIIIVLSLGFSLNVAIVSLLFLVIIHKLEYFLDAKIIGHQIQANTWEILLSLIIFETLFGISGLIIGSIIYCYIKMELKLKHLI